MASILDNVRTYELQWEMVSTTKYEYPGKVIKSAPQIGNRMPPTAFVGELVDTETGEILTMPIDSDVEVSEGQTFVGEEISMYRQMKKFRISNGSWEWCSDPTNPHVFYRINKIFTE